MPPSRAALHTCGMSKQEAETARALQMIATSADKFDAALRAAPACERVDMIAQRVAEADLVFALWKIEGADIAFSVVKGRAVLFCDDAEQRFLHVTGIACEDAAVALARLAGEKDMLN